MFCLFMESMSFIKIISVQASCQMCSQFLKILQLSQNLFNYILNQLLIYRKLQGIFILHSNYFIQLFLFLKFFSLFSQAFPSKSLCNHTSASFPTFIQFFLSYQAAKDSRTMLNNSCGIRCPSVLLACLFLAMPCSMWDLKAP